MAGAFGAHGLRNLVSERGLEVFQTAVSYQMYHALILVVASLMPVLGLPRKLLAVACGFWLVGILLFSGSLYLLVDRKSTRLNSSHVCISYAVFCLKKKKNK